MPDPDQKPPEDAPLPEQPPTPAIATVPDHLIPLVVPHPVTLGTPLSRGLQYFHHFEVLLVSDGSRLWQAVSEEGKAVLAAIRGEVRADEAAIEAHRASISGAGQLDPDGNPATGGKPVPTF